MNLISKNGLDGYILEDDLEFSNGLKELDNLYPLVPD